jgi:dihydroorotate dehydrogenase electron transfer subunit
MSNFYQTTKIKKIIRETDQVKTFVLETSISAQPGQYLMVWLPRINEKPFGVALPSPLTLSIAKAGPFTEKIHQLKTGDQLTFRGPYGRPFKLKTGKILLVGGGYGVVPLYFLAWSASKSQRKKITVIIGAKTKKELVFVSNFKKLGAQVLVSTDDGSAGFKGFSTQLAEKVLTKEKFKAVYTCGPEIMMTKIAKLSLQKKIFCQVSLERLFKCGIGLCGECSCQGKLVCQDGPVFNGKILST